MSENLQEVARAKPRSYGAVLVFLGGTLFYYFAGLPLQRALAGADETGTFSVKAGMVGFAVFALGVIMLIGGTRVTKLLKPMPGESKVPSYVLGFIVVGLGLAVTLGVQNYIERLGYAFR